MLPVKYLRCVAMSPNGMAGKQIGQLTLQERLPSVHGFKDSVASGGLMNLGPNMTSIAISGAGYVDRVL
jgi:putative tryptophan/tyrosine transport system substrate-binding protein